MGAPKESPAHGGNRGGADFSKHFAANSTARGEFRRDLLPAPLLYYEQSAGIRLSGRGAWRDALCPFHEDSRPSLRVHAESGAYACMACGARGHDVLAFHMRRHGLGFVDAARQLGAWGPA